MPHIEVVPAEYSHVEAVAARMRAADVLEVEAIGAGSPADGLRVSLDRTAQAWTALFDGRPEIMFGVTDANILAAVGIPWLLGTEVVETHYRVFARQSVWWREQLLRRYAVLRNVVDDRNEVSKRWLAWLGFTLFEPLPLGVSGELFRPFELRRT